jgi:glycosyltransferase involved in cell wall biosynthesis
VRIAIYHNLPSGGAKRALNEEVRRMKTRHEIDVFTLSTADHDFADLRPHVAGYRIYPFEPARLLRSPMGRANQVIRMGDLHRLETLGRQIAADMMRDGYDLAFIHPCMFEIAPSLLRHLNTMPSVYYCQEPPRKLYEVMPDRPYTTKTPGRAAIDRLDPLPGLYRSTLARGDRASTRSASRVLVNSQFVKTDVSAIYNLKPHVSYLGVDANWVQPGGGTREPFVLSVGSLTPLKGFDFVIRSVARIPAASRPPLTIASNFQNPPERAFLENLALEKGVRLTLAGNVSDAELADFYRRARVVAYSPIREPFGLVALEAMASATPVVAVAEGGIPETVIHERTGLLTSRDETEFAAALQHVYEDSALAARLGAAGREHVLRHWTWDHAITTLEEHFQAAVADGRARAVTSAPIMSGSAR